MWSSQREGPNQNNNCTPTASVASCSLLVTRFQLLLFMLHLSPFPMCSPLCCLLLSSCSLPTVISSIFLLERILPSPQTSWIFHHCVFLLPYSFFPLFIIRSSLWVLTEQNAPWFSTHSHQIPFSNKNAPLQYKNIRLSIGAERPCKISSPPHAKRIGPTKNTFYDWKHNDKVLSQSLAPPPELHSSPPWHLPPILLPPFSLPLLW